MAQTKTMVSWYKRIGNAPLPATKKLMLTRYVDTMGCDDAPVPLSRAIPPPAASAAEDDKDEVIVTEE